MKNKWFFIVLAMLSVGFISCNENDEINNENDDLNEVEIDSEVYKLSQDLFGTSWMHYKTVTGERTISSNGRVFTFTDEVAGKNIFWYSFDGYPKSGLWVVDENGVYIGSPQKGNNMTPTEMGAFLVQCCVSDGKIMKHNSSELVIQSDDSRVVYFKNVSEPDNNGTGSSSSYEKPDVGFYDFTATKTSLKVQYRIYNNDESKVNSATIYYGTTSNPTSTKTATVSGSMITANISGLKAGTTYYVKCVAKGKGGTTTSSTTKCITNY